MLRIIMQGFNDLTKEEQNNASNNGAGKEYASYLRVTHEGKTILLESDAMEPEDVMFCRDLRWIPGIIQKAYELGKNEKG